MSFFAGESCGKACMTAEKEKMRCFRRYSPCIMIMIMLIKERSLT